MKEIWLTPRQLEFGREVGLARCRVAKEMGHKDRDGMHRYSEEDKIRMGVIGAQAELAAAIALNVPWPAYVGAQGTDPDLPPNWQVKSSESHAGSLKVGLDAVDEQRYVLVTGANAYRRVVGWVLAMEAKQKQWLSNQGLRRPSKFWVPQHALRPIE